MDNDYATSSPDPDEIPLSDADPAREHDPEDAYRDPDADANRASRSAPAPLSEPANDDADKIELSNDEPAPPSPTRRGSANAGKSELAFWTDLSAVMRNGTPHEKEMWYELRKCSLQWLLREVGDYVTANEHAVLSFIYARTFDWSKLAEVIPVKHFTDGVYTQEGNRLQARCGVHRAATVRAITERLVEKGLIDRFPCRSYGGATSTAYMFIPRLVLDWLMADTLKNDDWNEIVRRVKGEADDDARLHLRPEMERRFDDRAACGRRMVDAVEAGNLNAYLMVRVGRLTEVSLGFINRDRVSHS